jgi:putative sigma-54 modulation protein
MPTKDKFNTDGYNLKIWSKTVPLTDAINSYVFEKLDKMDRFAKHIIDVSVTLDVQNLAHSVSMFLKFSHFNIRVSATTDNLYSAIDKASDKLKNLIEKYKKKLQNHHVEGLSSIDMRVNVLKEDPTDEINDAIEEETLKEEENLYKPHKIVKTETMSLKLLTQEEAVMKFELSSGNFLIYKCEEDQKTKMIYRNDDGNFAIVIIENKAVC